jgi:hypothetical protein
LKGELRQAVDGEGARAATGKELKASTSSPQASAAPPSACSNWERIESLLERSPQLLRELLGAATGKELKALAPGAKGFVFSGLMALENSSNWERIERRSSCRAVAPTRAAATGKELKEVFEPDISAWKQPVAATGKELKEGAQGGARGLRPLPGSNWERIESELVHPDLAPSPAAATGKELKGFNLVFERAPVRLKGKTAGQQLGKN